MSPRIGEYILSSSETLGEPSIALLTQRNYPGGRHPAYAALAEAEDILVETAGAELFDVGFAASDFSIRARRAVGALLRRARPGILVPAFSGSSRAFDIVIVILTSIWELPLLEAHPVIRSAGEVSVWVPEVWPSQFDDARLSREPYDIADHLFVGTSQAPDVLRRVLDREAHPLTWAVDVARFRPTDFERPRPVDVLNIGRRIEPLHEALLGWSASGDNFYEYDTTIDAKVVDPGLHRLRLADLYKRSSVAVTSYPKHDIYGEACAADMPSRLWEGLAAGALMIGKAPRQAAQLEIAGGVVVEELPVDVNDAVERLNSLVAEQSIDQRLQNVALAHRAHDWSHRWAELFRASGWPIPPGLTDRIDVLGEWTA